VSITACYICQGHKRNFRHNIRVEYTTCHDIYRKYKYNFRKQDLWMLHTRRLFQILCKRNIKSQWEKDMKGW